jgi:hypothetical protein
MNQKYLLLRRFVLQHFVPEWYWPKTIEMDGVAIPLRNMPYTFGTKWLIKKGAYEEGERKLLTKYLKSNDNVLEMGGSIGVLTRVIADKAKDGNVISIEASDKLVGYSKKWLHPFGNIKILRGFAFPVNKIPYGLNVNSFDEVKGSLGGEVDFSIDASKQKNTSEQLYDIERIEQEFNFRPSWLVIDIEGTETIWQTQRPQLPAYINYVLIELHAMLYKNGDADMYEIIASIESDGFTQIEHAGGVYLFERKKIVC